MLELAFGLGMGGLKPVERFLDFGGCPLWERARRGFLVGGDAGPGPFHLGLARWRPAQLWRGAAGRLAGRLAFGASEVSCEPWFPYSERHESRQRA